MEAIVLAVMGAAACAFFVYVFAHFFQESREMRRTAAAGSQVVRLGAPPIGSGCESEPFLKNSGSRSGGVFAGQETKIEAVL